MGWVKFNRGYSDFFAADRTHVSDDVLNTHNPPSSGLKDDGFY